MVMKYLLLFNTYLTYMNLKGLPLCPTCRPEDRPTILLYEVEGNSLFFYS